MCSSDNNNVCYTYNYYFKKRHGNYVHFYKTDYIVIVIVPNNASNRSSTNIDYYILDRIGSEGEDRIIEPQRFLASKNLFGSLVDGKIMLYKGGDSDGNLIPDNLLEMSLIELMERGFIKRYIFEDVSDNVNCPGGTHLLKKGTLGKYKYLKKELNTYDNFKALDLNIVDTDFSKAELNCSDEVLQLLIKNGGIIRK